MLSLFNFNFSIENIVQALVTVFVLMVSVVLHEIAHGYVAYLCGDNTAKDAGRLSLNPFAHLDPFGSVVLPLIMVLLGGPVFGYAKPVPYNPYNLRHRKRDELLVALSGPASNLLQAFVGACIFAVMWRAPMTLWATEWFSFLADVVMQYIYVNLVLMFFNLIPLPPLDGSSIIGCFLSGSALQKYYEIQRYSLPILLIVLYILPDFLHFDPLGAYLNATAGGLYNALMHWPVGAL
jgi:Zn-dependent protease